MSNCDPPPPNLQLMERVPPIFPIGLGLGLDLILGIGLGSGLELYIYI